MHDAAMMFTVSAFNSWAQKDRQHPEIKVLEIGAFNINGSARDVIEPIVDYYWGIDIQEGPGVDEVTDAATFVMKDAFDVVICNEVFEHTPHYEQIIGNAAASIRTGGIFIATMAGEGRPPHSALDENPIRPWEWYRNIGEWELSKILEKNFPWHVVHKNGTDLYCWGEKK